MTDRKSRVHVLTVRCVDGKYILELSDFTTMTWHQWCNGGRDDLLTQ